LTAGLPRGRTSTLGGLWLLRTADAVTPFFDSSHGFDFTHRYCAVYTFIFAFGVFYIYRLLRAGPAGSLVVQPADATPRRPMSIVDEAVTSAGDVLPTAVHPVTRAN